MCVCANRLQEEEKSSQITSIREVYIGLQWSKGAVDCAGEWLEVASSELAVNHIDQHSKFSNWNYEIRKFVSFWNGEKEFEGN